MNVIKKTKKRYSERTWVKSHNTIYKKNIYDRDDVNKFLMLISGYRERQRKIWRDLSKRKKGIIAD